MFTAWTFEGLRASKRKNNSRMGVILLVTLLSLSLGLSTEAGQLPGLTDLSSFPSSAGVVIYGEHSSDTGVFINRAGDVNGDGLQDFIVTSPKTSPNGRKNAGEAFIIFGSESLPSAINLTLFSASQGVRVIGANASDGFPYFFPAPAGDFNRDGYDDVLIAFYAASPSGRNRAGYMVLIYGGKSLPATIDVSTFTSSQGIFIIGANDNDVTGARINGLGDVNGDGYPDILIGATSFFSSTPVIGVAYLLLGSPTFPSTIDLAYCTTTYAAYCTLIKGSFPGGQLGLYVGPAGDVNGDGMTDFMVGAPYDPNGLSSFAGQLFVFYGRKTFPQVIDLATTSDFGGFVIGASTDDGLSIDASSAGDMNQDGYGDILVTLFNLNSPDPFNSTALYLIYGGSNMPSSINVADYPLAVAFVGDVGSSADFPTVSGNYDINQDGISDILLGLPATTLNDTYQSGAVLVIYGKKRFDGRVVITSQLDAPSEVARFHRAKKHLVEYNGDCVSFVGDVNGDGAVDFIFGAYTAENHSGRVYLIYGVPNSTPSTPTRSKAKSQRHSRRPSTPRSSPTPEESSGDATAFSYSRLFIFSLMSVVASHL